MIIYREKSLDTTTERKWERQRRGGDFPFGQDNKVIQRDNSGQAEKRERKSVPISADGNKCLFCE